MVWLSGNVDAQYQIQNKWMRCVKQSGRLLLRALIVAAASLLASSLLYLILCRHVAAAMGDRLAYACAMARPGAMKKGFLILSVARRMTPGVTPTVAWGISIKLDLQRPTLLFSLFPVDTPPPRNTDSGKKFQLRYCIIFGSGVVSVEMKGSNMNEFKCPQCGGNYFGSSGDRAQFGHCHGSKLKAGCGFTWNRDSKEMEGKCFPDTLEDYNDLRYMDLNSASDDVAYYRRQIRDITFRYEAKIRQLQDRIDGQQAYLDAIAKNAAQLLSLTLPGTCIMRDEPK